MGTEPGNGGPSKSDEIGVEIIPANIIENDPGKDYVVVKTADGSTLRLPKDTDVELAEKRGEENDDQ